jgi:hypothetical protein
MLVDFVVIVFCFVCFGGWGFYKSSLISWILFYFLPAYGAARSAVLRAEPPPSHCFGATSRLGITGPRSGTQLKTGTGDLCGVPVERRCATDAIRLHDPDFR